MNQETALIRRKVLFLITKATWGGAQRYVYDLATNLPAHFESVVAYGTPGRLERDLDAAGLRTIALPLLSRDVVLISDIRTFFAIVRTLKRERPDIIHLNSSKAAGLGALAARLAGVPRIIFTAHGWPHKEPRSALARSAILALSWCTAILCDEVIVVSTADEAIGRSMPGLAAKITHIPIGRSLPHLYTRETAWLFFRGLAPKLRALKTAVRIVTIAELTRNKGIRYAIEAMARLKERGVACTYTVIGDGEEYDRLRSLADERGISDRVLFVGFVPRASEYLRAFDLFLLPSLKEGMPYVLLEAGDAGLPIVTTTAADPAIAQVYERVSIVPAGNADDISDAIERTLKFKDAPPELREESRYPLREMVERTTALYAKSPR